nr:invasion associated locus B family protein [Phyllobacterium bourgognense]
MKPSEVAIPEGAELGRYRRTIQPFENWELRCDENLKAKKKICNITQTILDGQGQFAFSWSLAATENGKPLMILRTRSELGEGKPVTLSFPSRKEPVAVETNGCDSNVCVTYLPVGPVLREQIAKEANVQVSYSATGETTLVFEAPLKGLSAALAAIK